jgi:hypothetical protein
MSQKYETKVCNTANMSSELVPVWFSTRDLLAEVKAQGLPMVAGVAPSKLAATLTIFANGDTEKLDAIKA